MVLSFSEVQTLLKTPLSAYMSILTAIAIMAQITIIVKMANIAKMAITCIVS